MGTINVGCVSFSNYQRSAKPWHLSHINACTLQESAQRIIQAQQELCVGKS